MNYLANKPLRFFANRYEEWSAGMCISKGPIDAEIIATISGKKIDFSIKGADSLRMWNEVSYDFANDSGDLGDRIQYFDGSLGGSEDPTAPIVCHVFHENRTISYIRFAMSFPDRIIEFYGKLMSFNGIDRPDGMTGEHIPPMKKFIIDGIADQYRAILKENTVNPAIIDHQMACVAFSLRQYFSLLSMEKDVNGQLKEQVFKDTSSIISQFFPSFQNETLDDARNWFRQIASNPIHADIFLDYYYGTITSGQTVNCGEILRAFNLD